MRRRNSPISTHLLPPDAGKLSAVFEFRLGDAAEKRPQFAIRFCFEGERELPNRYGWIGFGTEKLVYRSAGKLEAVPFAAGTSFHAFTLEADRASALTGSFAREKSSRSSPRS